MQVVFLFIKLPWLSVEIACKVIVPFTGLITAFLSSVSAFVVSSDQLVFGLALRLSGPRKSIHDNLNYPFFLFYCIISVPFGGTTHYITRTLSIVRFKVKPWRFASMINFKPTDQIKHRLISVLGWRGICHKMYMLQFWYVVIYRIN